MECSQKILVKGAFLPCGKCPNCLANRRTEWVFRLKAELTQANFALFVTLTYDDNHVPVLPEYGVLTVQKRDVQLFLKRLRKALGNKSFRYFITAEYGDSTHRPHYHGLFFFKIDKHDSIYDKITESWQNGFTSFGEVEPASIAYCTKYCMKQTTTPPNANPPFQLMSRMPGIGYEGYLPTLLNYNIANLNLQRGFIDGESSRLPRYLRDKAKTAIIDEHGTTPLVYMEQLSYESQVKDSSSAFTTFCRYRKLDPKSADSWSAFVHQREAAVSRSSSLTAKHIKKQVL